MPDPNTLPSVDRLRELFSLDEATGELRWRPRPGAKACWNARCADQAAGHRRKSDGYVVVYIDNVPYRAHRIVFKMIHGAEPPPLLDHENRDRANNAPGNLRPASGSDNSANSDKKYKRRTSLPRFVYRSRDKFIAQVRKLGRLHHLGTFETIEAAEQAAIAAAKELHGEFFYA